MAIWNAAQIKTANLAAYIFTEYTASSQPISVG